MLGGSTGEVPRRVVDCNAQNDTTMSRGLKMGGRERKEEKRIDRNALDYDKLISHESEIVDREIEINISRWSN